jgi:hypothetical protein
LPPLNKEWTDDEVYEHFELSDDDIKLITNTNIIGYENNLKKSKKNVKTSDTKPKKVSKKKKVE